MRRALLYWSSLFTGTLAGLARIVGYEGPTLENSVVLAAAAALAFPVPALVFYWSKLAATIALTADLVLLVSGRAQGIGCVARDLLSLGRDGDRRKRAR